MAASSVETRPVLQPDDERWKVIDSTVLLYESNLAAHLVQRHIAAIERIRSANKEGYCLADLARLSQLFSLLADYLHEHTASDLLRVAIDLLRYRSFLAWQPCRRLDL